MMEKKIFGRGGRLTKWKGRVASVAPAAFVAVVINSNPAAAACVVAGATATCSGTFTDAEMALDFQYPLTGVSSLTLDNTVNATGTDAEDGFMLRAFDTDVVDLDLTVEQGASVSVNDPTTYAANAIYMINRGSGSNSITVDGAISAMGDEDRGVRLWTHLDEADDMSSVTVGETGTIEADTAGIWLRTGPDSRGGLSATIAGKVTSDEVGLHMAQNGVDSAAPFDVVIEEGGEVYGEATALFLINRSTTATNVQVEGTVTGGTALNTAEYYTDPAAILLSGTADAEITIGSNGKVIGEEGTAIYEQTSEPTSTDVTNAGYISGDVILGSGDDSFRQTGAGSLTGEMHLGDGSDTAEFDGSDLRTITVLDGGDDVATADGFMDTLTLSNVTATLSGAATLSGTSVINWETVELDASEVSFSDGALTTGEEDGYGLFLNSGTTLDVSGGFNLTGSLTNGALLTAMDDTAGDQITVSGNYAGDGGTIELDAELGDDSSAADTLEVAGDVTGTSSIYVNVVGGTGAETDMGILLVDVSGTSAADAFSLANELEAGAFTYGLEYSNPDDSSDQNWYLRSTGTSGGGAAFESAPGVLLTFSELSTLEQRVGQRQWWGRDSEARGPLQPAEGAWIRMNASQSHTMADSTSGAELETTKWLLQAGWDAMLSENDNGLWVLGGFVQAGTISSDLTTETSSAKIDGTGFGLGITGTWYGNSGTYVDLQSLVSLTRADYSSAVAGELANDQDATALAFSAEVGHRMTVSEHTALVPQAQLSYARIWGGEFTDNQGTKVDLGTNDSLIGRLGLAYEYEYSEGWLFGDRAAAGPQHQREKVYAIANILHDFSDDSSVSVGSADLASSGQDTWGEIGLGGSMTWDENKVVYTEGSYRRAFDQGDDNWGASVEVGFRMSW